MLHVALYAALEKWRLDTEKMKCELRILKKALCHISRRQLVKAWNKWVEVTKSWKQMRYRASGATIRMLNRGLSMAFEKWQVMILNHTRVTSHGTPTPH